MALLLTRNLRQRLWAGAGLLLLTVAASALIIWLFSADARREINALATANADSTQWSLAQSEVEFLALEAAVRDATVGGSASLDEVRRRFDVFYSRVQTLTASASFEDVRRLPDVERSLQRLEEFLENAIPAIDGNDAMLSAALPEMKAGLQAQRNDLREISLASVRVFAERSERQRERVAGALRDLGIITFFLLAVLFGVVAILLFLMRASIRQTAEIALTQSRLQAVISTSLDGILVVGRDGRVIDYNGAAERIFGYSRDEAIGADMATLIVPDHLREAHNAGLARYRETGEMRVVGSGLLQLEAKRKGGSTFPVELSINAAESEEGQIFVSFIRDISRRVAAENELVEARDKAVAGEKAKADLLAVMSHEMRTPLNGVLGTLQLLSGTKLDDRQRKYVEVMDTSGKMLLEHVNDVLDISRVDAGKAEVSSSAFDLLSLVDDVVGSLRSAADARGNILTVSDLGGGIGAVVGDEARLRQVLVNLLGNAIKFTENGRVSVEIEPVPGTDVIEFRIADTGIGIAEQDLDRVFDDFVTLDASYQREVEGTGLGLGIVRRLVDLMGGEAGVESELGEGTAFWVRLPLKGVASADADTEPLLFPEPKGKQARSLSNMSVLVVEDNETNRMVAREMLTKHGCRVAEARDGHEGVDRARSRAFDIILMDISMPKMDGIAAARAIRESGGPNTSTPIVALTAHALPDDIGRFREAGMDDVLTKPLSVDGLRDVLDQVAAHEGHTGGRQARNQAYSDLAETLGAERARDVFERVGRELSDGFGELHRMIEHKDGFPAIAALAHRLAGSAGLAGYDDVHRALIEIETQGDGDSREDLRARLKSAEALFRVVD